MALIHVNMFSNVLKRNVPVQVILPSDRPNGDMSGYLNRPGQKYKTLYLLHGLTENYMSCGTEDSLLDANRSFRDKLLRVGAEVTYREEAGGHEWPLWDQQIKYVIENWLPVEDI